MAVFVLVYCSDSRLCNRGLKEYAIVEQTEELRTQNDLVHLEYQDDDDDDDDDEYGSSNLVYESLHEEEERAECSPDDTVVDEEFTHDVELMKSMGLPLSFTASERNKKKVYFVVYKTTGQTKINLILI